LDIARLENIPENLRATEKIIFVKPNYRLPKQVLIQLKFEKFQIFSFSRRGNTDSVRSMQAEKILFTSYIPTLLLITL